MPLTASAKILARASGKRAVRTGDIVVATVDRAMTYDPYAGMLHRRFRERWGAQARLWDAERLVLVADHFLDSANPRHREMQAELDDFARAYGVRHYYPVGAANHGICHALLPEEGLVRPGELIAGTDSHSCHYGGFGAIGLGIGVDAMEGILTVGQCWLAMPSEVRIEVEGRFPEGVYAKDVVLRLARDLANEKGLLGTAVELDGEAVQALHPEEKLTLANMAAELGARWLVIPADDAVCEWVAELGARDFEPARPDGGARYARVCRYRGEDFEPVVALPGAPDDVVPLRELPRTEFTDVFVGSCTGAKRFDFERFLEVLEGSHASTPAVPVRLVPATRKVRQWLIETEARRARLARWQVELADEPGCNACCGAHGFLAGAEAVRFSTTNRNFPGRMGDRRARVFLGSPALAARVAAEGCLGA